MKTDFFQTCGQCWVFQICWHIDCSTFTTSSFRVWNSLAGIPSSPPALFIMMLPKVHFGEGNGTPLQYSCLENPMDGGAWWAAVHGVTRVGHDWVTSFSLSCIEEGNGNPLQCSCLENPRGRRAWWVDVYGVTQSRTWLKWLSSSSSNDFGAQENEVCHCFDCFPIYLPWSDGTGCLDLCFLNVEYYLNTAREWWPWQMK